jgi:hypothetical protein
MGHGGYFNRTRLNANPESGKNRIKNNNDGQAFF